jgi:hypothetical protein
VADNAFNTAFGFGNIAFQTSKGEDFVIIGTQRTVHAIEIAELSDHDKIALGGRFANSSVNIHVLKADIGTDLHDGAKILVRGHRLRIGEIRDNGDNSVMFPAEPAGVRIPRE